MTERPEVIELVSMRDGSVAHTIDVPRRQRAARIFVACPCYAGIEAEAVMSLIKLTTLGTIVLPNGEERTIEWHFGFQPRDSILERARARLVALFLARPDDTHLLMCDADGEFEPMVFARLLAAEKDIIGALFAERRKVDLVAIRGAIERNEPAWDLAGSLNQCRIPPQTIAADGLAELDDIGMGLTLIRRDVIEQTIAAHPDLLFENTDTDGHKTILSGVWHPTIENGKLYGEDVSFCRRAKALGFKVHALLDADTTHYGTIGMKANVLRSMTSSGAAKPQ